MGNGAFKGQPISSLVEQLLGKHTLLHDLPALVVVEFLGERWVICGNRRLKALQEFQAQCSYTVFMRCIVYDVDRDNVPNAVLAKFLDSATTTTMGCTVRTR